MVAIMEEKEKEKEEVVKEEVAVVVVEVVGAGGRVEEVAVEDLVVIEKDAGVVVITRTRGLVHAKHTLSPNYSLSPHSS